MTTLRFHRDLIAGLATAGWLPALLVGMLAALASGTVSAASDAYQAAVSGFIEWAIGAAFALLSAAVLSAAVLYGARWAERKLGLAHDDRARELFEIAALNGLGYAREVADRRPYLRYVALLDGRTRPAHLALHNTVLPFDDPFWGDILSAQRLALPVHGAAARRARPRQDGAADLAPARDRNAPLDQPAGRRGHACGGRLRPRLRLQCWPDGPEATAMRVPTARRARGARIADRAPGYPK